MAYCPKCDCDVAVNDDGVFKCPHGVSSNNSDIQTSSDEYQEMMTAGSEEYPDRE